MALFVGALGCDGRAAPEAVEESTVASTGPVVARVGGRAIHSDDVRSRMALEGSDARAALDALVAEAVLLHAAKEARVAPDEAALRKADRLMVRTLLHDMERDHDPEDIALERVQADFEEHRDLYQVLERRASTHLLAKASTDEARQTVARAHAEARESDDPSAALSAFANDDPAAAEVELVFEELPAITRKASIEKPFLDALFEAESTGLLNKPVQTNYGWHVIVVTDIQPPETRTLADVEDDIRDRLSEQSRFEALVALVQSLEAEGLVVYDHDVVTRLLDASEVPRRDP